MVEMFGLQIHEYQIIARILKEHLPLAAAVFVFGSRERGTERARSDIDLAVEAPAPLSRETRYAILDAFEDSELPIRVDIVETRSVSEQFREIIRREGRPFMGATTKDRRS